MGQALNVSARAQRGAALVEFALVLPLLLLLCLTVVELGRAFWHYKVLVQSAREAARYLAAQKPGEGAEQARNLVLRGSLSDTGPYQLSDLTASQPVQVSWQRDTASGMALVSVTVPSYAFNSLLVSWAGVELGRVEFRAIAATQRIASCGTAC